MLDTFIVQYRRLSEYLLQSKDIVIFTGAGISTESGISDYRSKGGLWDRFQPVTIQEFLSSEEKRKEYWRTKMELYASFKHAQPNVTHRAIVDIDQIGKLKGVITQNIDGLHQMAGLDHAKVVELHGNNRETICLSCKDITPWQEVYLRLKNGEGAPRCLKCRGLLKPKTISFGQSLDPLVLNQAISWSRQCDLMLSLGSTLIVEPAASIPRMAKQNGAKLVIITLSETPLDNMADLKIQTSIGEALCKAMDFVRRQIT